MAFKLFTIWIHDSGQGESELNAFLRSHKVLSVERGWVEQGSGSFWSFYVDYLEPSSGGTGDGRQAGQRGKVDYKASIAPFGGDACTFQRSVTCCLSIRMTPSPSASCSS